MTAIHRPHWRAATLAVSCIYTGALAGVSFLATPVKFLAPSLQLPVALDVGRYTFAAFNKVEWAAAVILLACCLFSRVRWKTIAAVAIAGAVAADTIWLLPNLDVRVASIMRGQWPEPSLLHQAYIALDIAKFLLLVAIAASAGVDLVRSQRPDLSSSVVKCDGELRCPENILRTWEHNRVRFLSTF
jgi:hypothetical protein